MQIRAFRQFTRRTVIVSVVFALAFWTIQPALVYAAEDSAPPPATETTEASENGEEVVAIPLSQVVEPEELTIQEGTVEQSTTAETSITASSNLSEPLSQSTQTDSEVEQNSSSTITNDIDSEATSGDATGSQNTTVGDVSTGDATAIATLINMLLSGVQLEDGTDPLVFIHNVYGNVNGNLLIDPEALATNGNASQSPLSPDPAELDSNLDATINNTVNLDAQSGNATAHTNTNVGDVSTGNATAIANIINLINSSISANDSFIGMINIFGNLEGDILVPHSFVEQVLAAHNASQNPANGTTTITNDQTATVSNNVNANAQSGDASAINNSHASNESTGNATTNVTILNLTSQQIVGSNVLLVFVNVLGNWVGLLLDAPAGTTSAALGDSSSSIQGGDIDINNTTNLAINNNVNVNAQSGDATAHTNTNVGDVSSGNATASVNLLNILNSDISLANWFGVLFINVFGEWVGDFAIAPEETNNPGANPDNGSGSGTPSGNSGNKPVFSFVPGGSTGNIPLSNFFDPAAVQTSSASTDDNEPASEPTGEVKSAAAETAATTQLDVSNPGKSQTTLWIFILFALAAFLTLLYILSHRRKEA